MMKRVDAVVKELLKELPLYMDRPFAFFGHSMGAMIAFELARALRNDRRRQPEHMFISGRRPPDVPSEEDPDYDLPAADLVARLRHLNGTPQEILDNPEALELMLPVVRADFEIVQTYQYQPQHPLEVAMDVFAGSQDTNASAEQMEGWKRHTTGPFSQHVIPGDHFFILHAQKQLLDLLAAGLNGVVRRINLRHITAAR
jgi:medium-chain acyl-[acyl-carrier-protein] hydrolase